MAISLILNAKKGISSRQLSRDINVNKDTAWYMQMRVRRAMAEHAVLLNGIVEIDETYVGGALRNKTKKYRKAVKDSGKTITGMEHKKPVLGMVQRGGNVVSQVLIKAHGESIKPVIDKSVERSATIITDGFGGYYGLNTKFSEHQIVNHEKDEFVRGTFHTNTIEGFWSILKRSIIGQYHHVSGKYLQLYVNECCYKYNNRKNIGLFHSFITSVLTVNST
jgi:transposase-like protein